MTAYRVTLSIRMRGAKRRTHVALAFATTKQAAIRHVVRDWMRNGVGALVGAGAVEVQP